MIIDMPENHGPWTPAAPGPSWADRLAAARAALDATEIDLSNDRPDPDEADRAELVARYRARFGL